MACLPGGGSGGGGGGRARLTAVGNAVVDHLLEVPCVRDYLRAGGPSSTSAWGAWQHGHAVAGGGTNLVALPAEVKRALIGRVKAEASCEAVVGGSALTTARVAARAAAAAAGRLRSSSISGASGGLLEVGFVGAVGDDVSGRLIRSTCGEEGVQAMLFVDAGAATGECAVLVDGGSRDRTIACTRGASGSLSPLALAALEREWPGWLQRPTSKLAGADRGGQVAALFVTAFVLTTPPRAEVVGLLATRHDYLALSLSSSELLRVSPDVRAHLARLIASPEAALVFATAQEVQAYAATLVAEGGWSGGPGSSSSPSTEQAVQRLLAPCGNGPRRAPWVVVTDGPNDVLVGRHGRASARFRVPAVEQTRIVDTNGAGDAFAGAFLAEWLSWRSVLLREPGGEEEDQALACCVQAGIASARACLLSKGGGGAALTN